MDAMIEAVKSFQDAVDSALISVEALHAGIDDLPSEHVTDISLTGDVPEQVAAINAALDEIPDHKNVLITAEQTGTTGAPTGDSAGAINNLTDALDENAAAWSRVEDVGRDYSVMMGETIADADEASGALDRVFAVTSEGEATLKSATEGVQDFNAGLERMDDVGGELAGSIRETGDAADALGSAVQDSLNAGFLAAARTASALDGGLGDVVATAKGGTTAFEALGAMSFTAAARMNTLGGIIHWIIAGGSELAATLIPAMIALGAAASVQAEAWGDMYVRMSAVNEVGQSIGGAFGKTVGQILGLGDALQKAQTAADPQVFEFLGAAINAVNQSSGQFIGMGQQLTGFMEQFAAKIDVDLMQGMTQFTGLLSKGAVDAVEFGQVLGNIGHALLNFASDMPGLAEVLLAVIDGISQLILWLSKLPPWIITTVMVIEELFRWGGLLVGVFASIGEGIAAMGFLGLPIIGKIVLQFGEMFENLALGAVGFVGNLGQMLGGLRNIVPGAEAAAAAMMEFDVESTAAIAGADTGIAGLGVVAALGFGALMMWMINTKNATQQWVDSLEQSVNAAQGLQQIGQTYTALAQVTSALAGAQKQLGAALAAPGGQIVGSMTRFQGYSDAVEDASVKVGVLSQAQQQLRTDFGNEVGNVAQLSSEYKIGYVEAAELAGNAGVSLTTSLKGTGLSAAGMVTALKGTSTAAEEAAMQINNYVQGLGGMGAVQGTLGADINAVTIDEDLQGSQTQKLTQSLSELMTTIQAPSSGFLSFAQSLQQYGSDAQAAGAQMTGLGGATVKSTKDVNDASIQLQQDFNSSVSAAQGYIDSLTTAAAITGNNGPLVAGIKDLIAVLVPMAGTNQNAAAQISVLWQEAGGSASDGLSQIAKAVSGIKNPMQALENQTGAVSLSMANLGQDAQNLANTISSSLNQALVAQAETLTGVSAKSATYLSDLQQYGPTSVITQAALAKLNSATSQASLLATEAAEGIQALTGRTADASAPMVTLAGELKQIISNAGGASTNVGNLKTALLDNVDEIIASGATRQQLITDLRNAGVQAGEATKLVDGLETAIKSLTNKTVTITTQMITTGQTPIQGINSSAAGVAPHHATGWLVPGFGGGDIHPALLEGGETVVPKELTPAVAPLMKAHGVPGFQSGGIAGGWYDDGFFPGLASMLSGASGGSSGGGGGGAAAQPLHVHLMLDGREMAQAVIPDLVGAVGRYGVRNAGKATGLLKPS